MAAAQGKLAWNDIAVSETVARPSRREDLSGELIGSAELGHGDYVVHFCSLDVGLIDRGVVFRRFAPPRPRRKTTFSPVIQH